MKKITSYMFLLIALIFLTGCPQSEEDVQEIPGAVGICDSNYDLEPNELCVEGIMFDCTGIDNGEFSCSGPGLIKDVPSGTIAGNVDVVYDCSVLYTDSETKYALENIEIFLPVGSIKYIGPYYCSISKDEWGHCGFEGSVGDYYVSTVDPTVLCNRDHTEYSTYCVIDTVGTEVPGLLDTSLYQGCPGGQRVFTCSNDGTHIYWIDHCKELDTQIIEIPDTPTTPTDIDSGFEPDVTGEGEMIRGYDTSCLFTPANAPEWYSSSLVTNDPDGDADGDGIKNSEDKCPLDKTNTCAAALAGGTGGLTFPSITDPMLTNTTLPTDPIDTPKEPIEYDQCPDPDTFEDTYQGVIFTLEDGTVLDTRDRLFEDSLGDYPTDFEMSYDVELMILDSADNEGTCWFFLRALEVYDGDEPEFYVKFSLIEDFINLTECTSDDECEEGYYCDENNTCVESECDIDSDCGDGYYCEDHVCYEEEKEISALIGFYPVLNEEITDADNLDALSIGYYDEENSNDLDIDNEGLDLFIKTDETKYLDDDEILFDDIDFSEIIYDDSAVKAYWIMDNLCDSDISTEDLVELYTMFEEENQEIPVMIRFDDLDCALDYFEDAEQQFTDIVLFNINDVDDDADTASEILDVIDYRIKILPIINKQGLSATELNELGLGMIEKDEFYGIILSDEYLDLGKSSIDYRNSVREIFCMADEKYNDDECEFEEEKVKEVKIAFIGNSGIGTNAVNVLNLINKEESDLVVHLGNLGYEASPAEFADMLETNLEETIPFVAVIGSEEFAVKNWDNYESELDYLAEDLDCEGTYGNKMACYLEDVSLILSGVGTDYMTSGHESFITEKLKVASEWKVCAWHKANKDLRISSKDENDNLGLNYYELCKNAGAIIITGYDQAYARTKLLTSLDPVINSQYDMLLDDGSVVFISGLGGHGSDKFDCTLHNDDDWWHTIFTPNYYLNEGDSSVKSCDSDVVSEFAPGVLFITFNYEQDPNQAKAQFITIEDEIIDSAYIYKEYVGDNTGDDDDDDDDETDDDCIPVGVSFIPDLPNDPYYEKSCCEGVIIPTESKYEEDCTEKALSGYRAVCSDCGNGVCDTETGEYECNCETDCSE